MRTGFQGLRTYRGRRVLSPGAWEPGGAALAMGLPFFLGAQTPRAPVMVGRWPASLGPAWDQEIRSVRFNKRSFMEQEQQLWLEGPAVSP